MNNFIVIYIGFLLLNIVSFSNGNFEFSESKSKKSSNNDVLGNEIKLSSTRFGQESVNREHQLENIIANSKIKIKDNSVSHGQVIDSIASPLAIEEDVIAQQILKATKNLIDSVCSANYNKECESMINNNPLPECDLKTKCMKLRNETHLNSYRRLHHVDYSDGIYKMRKASDGISKLPNPRDITSQFFSSHMNLLETHSSHIVNEEGILDSSHNILLASFTQFIEQDLARTIVRTMANGKNIECCDYPFKAAPRHTHPACYPLEISPNDPFYKRKHVQCLNYVRSALSANCKFGPANQNNEASDIFDLSQLYGIHEETTIKLRTLENGLLKTSGTNTNQMLLYYENETDDDEKLCLKKKLNDTTICYKSGDPRVNSNPYITIIHTLFLRNHNNYAKNIKLEHPNWSDEEIFLNAREMNTALYQKIIYEEWANVVLGRSIGYLILNTNQSNINRAQPGVSNEFATAAIRFYNTMLPGDLIKPKIMKFHENVIDSSFDQKSEILKLQDFFYRPINLNDNKTFDEILNALIYQRAMAFDTSLVDDLTTEYYRSTQLGDYGTDVLALDILRGRDHGITGYVKYAAYCNNINIYNWNDLTGLVKSDDIERLKAVYNSVKDIDLIMGLLSEIHLDSGTVGPTTACILGEQLINSRWTDINFYTKQLNRFHHIKTKSLANLLCETTNLRKISKNPFVIMNERTEILRCNQ